MAARLGTMQTDLRLERCGGRRVLCDTGYRATVWCDAGLLCCPWADGTELGVTVSVVRGCYTEVAYGAIRVSVCSGTQTEDVAMLMQNDATRGREMCYLHTTRCRVLIRGFGMMIRVFYAFADRYPDTPPAGTELM